MTGTEILEAVLDLLNGPDKWCKETLARNAEGKPAAHDGSEAVSWCLMGAIDLCIKRDGIIDAQRRLERMGQQKFHEMSIATVNDDHFVDYEDMRLFVKEAIALGEKEKGA